MTVACVLRSRGIYTPAWIYALRRGLNRHAPDARLRILTDMGHLLPPAWTANGTVVDLEHGWPGWWSKIEAFRPGIFDGPTLYVDLDTLIVGDIAELLAYDGEFAALSDFYRPKLAQSGVMAWTPGETSERLWEAFSADPDGMMRRYRGDGEFVHAHVGTCDRLQDLFPGKIASLKVHARQGPPEGASIVACHGRPKLDDPAAGWAHEAWCDLTRRVA